MSCEPPPQPSPRPPELPPINCTPLRLDDKDGAIASGRMNPGATLIDQMQQNSWD